MGTYTRVRTRVPQDRANKVAASISRRASRLLGKTGTERTRRICRAPTRIVIRSALNFNPTHRATCQYLVHEWVILPIFLSDIFFSHYVNTRTERCLHSLPGSMNYYRGTKWRILQELLSRIYNISSLRFKVVIIDSPIDLQSLTRML